MDTTCAYCPAEATAWSHGKGVCDEHIETLVYDAHYIGRACSQCRYIAA